MSEPNPRKRRRPALSCEQCRRRKVRCDREMPCGPCSKSHPQLSCEYVHEGKVALDARVDVSHRSGDSGSPLGDAARIAELERTVHALQDRLQGLEQVVQVTGTRKPGPGIPSDASSGELAQAAHVADDRLEQQGGQRRSSRSERPQTLISPSAPRLKRKGENARLLGPTHWAISFQQFRLLRQARGTAMATSADGAQDNVGSLLKEIRPLRHVIKSRQAPRLAEPAPGLLNDLPSRTICDKLVENYLRTLGSIYRVLHIPVFYQDYEGFWENPQSSSTGFVIKLFLIFTIGSIFHCKPGPSNELGLPVRKWMYAAQWWLLGPSEKEPCSLEGLQVYCLLLLCRQGYAIEKERNWILAGTLLRLAINQGLHRDPVHFPTVSAFDGEMRRRIWATVLELNIQLAIDAAMPPLLGLDDFDTHPPSNLDDDDFDQTTSSLPPAQEMECYTTSSLQTLLSRSFPTRLRITRTMNQCASAQSYESALQLGKELTTACKEMTTLFQKYFLRAQNSTLPPTTFHHRLMDTSVRRFLLNLYLPFTIQALKDPRFYLSRKLSVDSALIIASYGDPPSHRPEDQTTHQDYQRLSLSGAGLFKFHLSLDVMIVISLELITQAEEEAAASSTASDLLPLNTADQIAQATRAPLVQALEKIEKQLYESLVAGIPSMKRYCLLAGILAQVQAAPRGEQAQCTDIREAFMGSMKTCRTLLQQYISMDDASSHTPVGGSTGWTSDSAIRSSLDSEFLFPNLGFDDLSFWDIPAFIDGNTFDSSQLQ